MERYLRPGEICQLLKIKRPTLWRWRQKGQFPEAQLLGPGSIGWLESVVREWQASRPSAGKSLNP